MIYVSLHILWRLGIVAGRWDGMWDGRLDGRPLGGIGCVFIGLVVVGWRGPPACPWLLSSMLRSWPAVLFIAPFRVFRRL
jgi:hypothetical protein